MVENKKHNKIDKEMRIIAERLKGKTLEEIGKLFGITRERVRQIEASGAERVWLNYYHSNKKHG